MRSSLLTRSVVAVASLAIGSVALAAIPATAATPAGTTRDEVLSLATAARANGSEISNPMQIAAAAILNRECGYAAGRVVNPGNVNAVTPLTGDAAVDGVYVIGTVRDDNGAGTQVGDCALALVAPRATGTTLSGQGTLTVTELVTSTKTASSALSGDAGLTALPSATNGFPATGFTYSATGTATTTSTATTVTKVATPKSKAQKKAAKKKYEKRLSSAKKSYKKALAKAKSSKTKKAAAKKAYRAKRASAKAAYKKAIASFKLVTRTTTTTTNSPFTISGSSSPIDN